MAKVDVTSPIVGTFAAVMVTEGDEVDDGDMVAMVEAMKVMHYLRATAKGAVHIVAEIGAVVNKDDVLMIIDTGATP